MDMQELEYVGFWSRVGATIIDAVILLVLTGPVMVAIYGWRYYTDSVFPFIAGPADFIINWVLPALATIWLWRCWQATPGKFAIGARIVDASTGAPASTGQYIGRYLAYFVSTIPLCLGYVWVAFDSRKRGWHDLLAGTVVVRARDRHPEPVHFDHA